MRPNLLTTVGNEQGEGNVEGEQVATDSYIFLAKEDLETREWDFAEFKRDKLKLWTRAGYVFEGGLLSFFGVLVLLFPSSTFSIPPFVSLFFLLLLAWRVCCHCHNRTSF